MLKRLRLHTAIIVLIGLSCHIIYSCECLKIGVSYQYVHRLRLPKLATQRTIHQHYRESRSMTSVALQSSSSKDGNIDDNTEDMQRKNDNSSQSLNNDVPLQDRLVGYLSILKTAAVSFFAGSLVAIICSMILFNYSLVNDQTVFQSAGLAKSAPNISGVVNANPTATYDKDGAKKRAVELYKLILTELDETYVDDIDPNLLFETTTRAMLKTLDPYTEYISPQDIIQKRQSLVGIGAFVMKAGSSQEMLDGKSVSSLMSRIPSAVSLPNQLHGDEKEGYRVILSLEGFAYDDGLRVGDEILEIDNQPIATPDITLEKVREMLMGDPGTKVKLAVRRPGVEKVQTIDVERRPVQLPDLPYAGILSNHDDIGYIKLHHFGPGAGVSMKKALESMQNNNMKGLILDLRDNSGGELLSAVQIASMFVPEGTYLGCSEGKGSLYPNERYYSGKLNLAQYGYANSDDFLRSNRGNAQDILDIDGKPMIDTDKTKIVILTNRNTASAAEFLSGVFQDEDIGIIVGEDKSTYGKGIGQREIGLPYGKGALKLTYHEFYTPSGRCVQPRTQNSRQKKQSKEFYTKNGRSINDRVGIEVDDKVELDTSLLSKYLAQSGAYFDFATEYCTKHKLALGGDQTDFEVDESIYKSFKSYVVKEQRRGTLKLEEVFDNQHLLENIQNLSTKSNLNHDASLLKRSLASLRGNILNDLLNDFDAHKDTIKKELEQNIVARQLSDSSLIRRSLMYDELVREAVQVMQDTNRYNNILNKDN